MRAITAALALGALSGCAQKSVGTGPSTASASSTVTPASASTSAAASTSTRAAGSAGDAIPFGAAGIDLRSVGEGGGGRGEACCNDGSAAEPSAPPPSANARIGQGSISVKGGLSPEVVSRVVREKFDRFRLCYEQGLRESPTLAGLVAVDFVIDRTGAVERASGGGSQFRDEKVVACIVHAFESLSFPKPATVGAVSVHYPLLLAPPEPRRR